MRRLVLLAVGAALLLPARTASAQRREVSITIPAGVSFLVTDVSTTTQGSPGPMRIAFAPVTLRKNDNLRISVTAASATFSGPGTTRIPASAIAWTATTPSGTASGGTLSSTAYSPVYVSPANPAAATVDVSWLLGPIAAPGLRAGTHSLTVRWRVEAF
jgi:hypothetical protein